MILARSLSLSPLVLITDEPTRGIDVGKFEIGLTRVKFEIQARLSDLAANGMAILIISSELEELLEGTHRTVVMRDGRTVATLSGEDLCEQSLVALMSTDASPER